MKLSDRKVNRFLLTVEAVGAIFVGIFLSAYFGGLLVAYLEGLPLTTVIHSEPAFRVSLFIFGVVFLFLLMSALIPVVLSED
jgi:hypothetical protein